MRLGTLSLLFKEDWLSLRIRYLTTHLVMRCMLDTLEYMFSCIFNIHIYTSLSIGYLVNSCVLTIR
jgi:hypothetical protein